MCDEDKKPFEVPAYDAEAIETKWQQQWADTDLYKTDEDPAKPKKFVMEMFPYPSGDLHMGHARNYTIGDAMARQARMRGYDVLHPMGFDAFGLPAENAAIKHNTQAGVWTHKNIEQAVKTMKRMGFSYDYDRMFNTCDPEYYKWGQWTFLKMWEKGLAYRSTSPVNWCPSCNTVLANEQVVDGKCWRCGSVPEKRELSQWYLKITDYAQELLDDLDQLEGWPENVKAQQRNWIGRSEGAEIDFALADVDGVTPTDRKITVFTTRADTLFGVSFFLLPPESPLAAELVAGTEYEAAFEELKRATEQVSNVDRQGSEREKHGVFTGRYVINPINGRPAPIWVADYVLMDYGTGAVMGVPCGDQRDFDFAKKYGLEIAPIICEKDDPLYEDLKDERELRVTSVDWDRAMVAEGYLVQSGEFTGLKGGKHSEAVDAIIGWLSERGLGREKVQFRLRDWLISRQRYWGNPIPMIHCDCCGDVPVPYDQLPVTLPENLDLGAGETLAEYAPFYETTCPECGKPARRITDTMDTFTCPGTTCATPTPTTRSCPSPRRPWTAGCRWTTTSAASSTPSCTCSTAASGRRSCATSAWSTSTSPLPTCSARAWSRTSTATSCPSPRATSCRRRASSSPTAPTPCASRSSSSRRPRRTSTGTPRPSPARTASSSAPGTSSGSSPAAPRRARWTPRRSRAPRPSSSARSTAWASSARPTSTAASSTPPSRP